MKLSFPFLQVSLTHLLFHFVCTYLHKLEITNNEYCEDLSSSFPFSVLIKRRPYRLSNKKERTENSERK
jgi:hypothetical protein